MVQNFIRKVDFPISIRIQLSDEPVHLFDAERYARILQLQLFSIFECASLC